MGLRKAAVLAAAITLAACSAVVPVAEQTPAQSAEVVQPVATAILVADTTPTAAPVSRSSPVGPATFVYEGELTQGGWLRGRAPEGTVTADLDGQNLVLDDEGRFFAAFDRDLGSQAVLTAQLRDGRTVESPVAIAPREWNIERVNVARRSGGITDAFWKIREPELKRINAARGVDADSSGWAQDFIWPAKGRISGRFGSQRIYRGEPGSYHSGIDIAPGNGVPFVAPADGIVTLAASGFSLEGNLLIIDHGQGLNSAFLHMSRIAVREGEKVNQGQYIGNIGSSGRATGPHLHWSLKWRDARLDPLLFTGPMN